MSDGYNERIESGVKWENDVKQKLEKMGYPVSCYGQSQLNPDFRKIIRFLNKSSTARFIRYLPDLVIKIKNECYFIEAKTDIGTTNNYSYEQSSYNIGQKLSYIGVNVIIVFTGWRADFIYNLYIHREFDNFQKTLNVKGSRTPFLLIKKNTVPPFDDFFKNIDKYRNNSSKIYKNSRQKTLF